MKITREEVEKLAHLSRLQLNDAAVEQMQADMNKMLVFVEKINELEIENIEPLTYMVEDVNIMRKDEERHDISHDEALKNAPDADSDYFKVPKVMR